MQILLKDVKLVYTGGMTNAGKFGYGYSFIVDKDVIAEKALTIAKAAKKVTFSEKELTPTRMLNFMNAKSATKLQEDAELKDDPSALQDIIAHMGANDVLVGVKAKGRVKATKSTPIGWFSVADIYIDMYATEYQGRKFISRSAAADKITVKVTKYEAVAAADAPGFESEEETPAPADGFAAEQTDSDIPF